MAKISTQLNKEFKDPLAYLSNDAYDTLHKRALWNSLRALASGLFFFGLNPFVHHAHLKLYWPGLLLVGLGLFQLFTLRKAVAALRQSELIREYPELNPRNSSNMPPLRTRIRFYVIYGTIILVCFTIWVAWYSRQQ